MSPAERDAYVVDQLAAFAAKGLTPRQCVNEVLRTSGQHMIQLNNAVDGGLDTDITNVQMAVSDLTVAATRTAAVSFVKSNPKAHLTPKLADISTTDHYRARVVNANR